MDFTTAGLQLTLSGNTLRQRRVLITEIGNNSGSGLVCSYVSLTYQKQFGWYHEQAKIQEGDKEMKGWSTYRARQSFTSLWFTLFRTPGKKAVEGEFTCRTIEGSLTVNIFYPSE